MNARPDFPPPATLAPSADELLAELPWGVLVLSGGGSLLRLNQAAAAAWGLPPELALLGRPVQALPAGRLPRSLYQALLAAATGAEVAPAAYARVGQPALHMRTTRRPDGSLVVYWQEVPAPEVPVSADEQKYRDVLHHMPQGFCIIELIRNAADTVVDYRFLETNAAFTRQTGLHRVVGRTIREVAPDIEDHWPRIYGEVARSRRPRHFEELAEPIGNGWYEVFALPTGPPEAERVAILFNDVSARRRAEHDRRQLTQELEQLVQQRTRQLHESAALLQSVFDASADMVVVLRNVRDEQGQIIDFEYVLANAVAQHYEQHRPLRGLRYSEIHPGAASAGIMARCLRTARTGERADFEVYYAHEGYAHWFRIVTVPLPDGLVMTAQDISQQKQGAQVQARHLQLLRQAEDVAPLGCWDYDLHTHELHWSAGMYRLFGLPADSVVTPQIYRTRALPDDLTVAHQLLRGFREQPASGEYTLRVRVGSQVRTLRCKMRLLRDADGQPARLLGVDVDVTETRRLEAENLAMRLDRQQTLLEAVLEAQEEERRRLAESLHNGLGQLLYAVKLQLESRPATAPAPALTEAERLLVEAIRQTRALSHELVPPLLAEFGLEAAVREMCRSLSTPHLHWQCLIELGADPLPVTLPLPLLRLAQELVQNVVKHAEATAAALELTVLPDWVVLRVEDNGRGFDPATARTGLGLRTIYQRVSLLGGTVQLVSAPGAGTQIQIRIPLKTSAAVGRVGG